MADPWDVLPRKIVGDPSADELYRAVGYACASWERLDSEQGLLFGVLVSSPLSDRRGAAEIAYGTVSSLAGRSDMVLAAADRLLANSDRALLDEIVTMINQIGKLAGRRNEIAHGVVMGFRQYGKMQGHWLVPALYNSRKKLNERQMGERLSKVTSVEDFLKENLMLQNYKYAYVAEQVIAYAKHFTEYRNKMTALVHKAKDRCDELFPWRDKLAQQLRAGRGQFPETKS